MHPSTASFSSTAKTLRSSRTTSSAVRRTLSLAGSASTWIAPTWSIEAGSVRPSVVNGNHLAYPVAPMGLAVPDPQADMQRGAVQLAVHQRHDYEGHLYTLPAVMQQPGVYWPN